MGSQPAQNRRRRPLRAVDGYPSGTDAPQQATALALAKVEAARCIVLVEGVSDQIAVETLARRHGRDLDGEGVVVLPIGGAQAIPKFILRFRDREPAVRLCGLCDWAEAPHYRRALSQAGLLDDLSGEGCTGDTDADVLSAAGFLICTADLEDELIRAAGRAGIEAVLAEQNDLRAFASLGRQPAWRDQPFAARMRRFLGAKSGRKSRYAEAIILAIDIEDVPKPLAALIDWI